MSRKNTIRKLLIFVLMASLVLGQFTPVQAAAKKAKYTIALNKQVYTMKKGKSVKLKATLNKAAKKKGVEWKSSNPKIASVSKSGKVTAKKNGKATITAKVRGTKVNAKSHITVGTPISKVTLNKKTVSLKIGQKFTLKATISPKKASNKKVSYESSNSKVATVNKKGVIRAISAGTAKIRVTAADGSGKKVSCTVKVSKSTVPVASVRLNKTQLTLKQGGEERLTATVNPSDATDKTIRWASSNQAVARVSENGTVRAVAKGTATITASAHNNVRAACTVTVESASGQPEEPTEPGDGKILVAYFSWSGTSERIANSIIEQTGADSFRIERETPYSDDYNEVAYGEAKDEADNNARPPIKNLPVSVGQYDRIVLCYPIWWHTAPMTVGTFLESYDLSGKYIYPVSQSASMDASQYAQSVEFIKTCAPGAVVDDGIFSKDDTAIRVYIADKVMRSDRIPVASVELNKSQIMLKPDAQETLIATVNPANATNPAIQWASSNPAVAVVSDGGTVKAVAEGTATITVSAENGIQAACTVTVEPASVQPEEPTEPGERKILVAYFSWSGTSERIANNIIEQTGADPFRIERETPYSDDYNEVAYGEAKDEADNNARPPIKNPLASVGQYDRIVLCYPIWWHTAPMTVGTFLESYDFGGKHIYPVSQSASMDVSQYEQSIEFIKTCAPGAVVDNGLFSKDNSVIRSYIADTVMKPVEPENPSSASNIMSYADVPLLPLNNGVQIPQLGLGTQIQRLEGDSSPSGRNLLNETSRQATVSALQAGYRHLDTAHGYYNERGVGQGIIDSGVPREEIWLTSKLWPSEYGEGVTMEAINAMLDRLQVDYLDCIYLHHPVGDYVGAWKDLEKAYRQGKVRALGISNFDNWPRAFHDIVDDMEIKPAILQIECHPFAQRKETRALAAEYGIQIECWYPLGHADARLLQNPVLMEIAEAHGKSVVQVILRWHVQEGFSVIPGSTNPAHIQENIDIFDFELSAEEMEQIRALDSEDRYFNLPYDQMTSFFPLVGE